MKHATKTCLFLLLSFISIRIDAQSADKKADKNTEEWRYEIECIGTGVDGTYIIKVWSYSKKPEIAIEQAKKNAVHGILFKGIPGTSKGCITQPPLTNNPNLLMEKESFFNDFFSDGGKYAMYANVVSNEILAGDRIKVSNKEYKIGVVVTISKDLLRKDLESAGIIPKLGNQF